MMETILNNEWLSALTIFFTQIVFIYLRTLNVIYTTERRILPTVLTGNGIGLAWLIVVSVGANSIVNGNLLTIIAFLLGGTLGAYWGLKQEKLKKV